MKKKQKKTSESLSLFLANCFGIIFIALSIIAVTGETVIGSTLTYCFAYLFGVFYPFFFAFTRFITTEAINERQIIPPTISAVT